MKTYFVAKYSKKLGKSNIELANEYFNGLKETEGNNGG